MLGEVQGVYGGDDILPGYPGDTPSVLYVLFDFAVEYSAATSGEFEFSRDWGTSGMLATLW